MPHATPPTAGPFTPDQHLPVYFVHYADDCLLHFTAEQLTAKQREDHAANVVLTAMLQVALTFMGRSKDHVALHDRFAESQWAPVLEFYHRLFTRLFTDVIPSDHYHYFPSDGFYEAVAAEPLPAALLSLYMVSGSNLPLHADAAAWQRSQQVNSKMHFAHHAPLAGLPVPATLVCTKASLAAVGPAFFARHAGVMLKIQGLAGARNVTPVADLNAAHDYLAEYADDIEVLLQQRLDTSQYTEMTVDLKITDSDVTITNTRQILFADGLWVGNYISSALTLSRRQQEVCLQVGAYVRELGYTSPHGVNCGIDFFVRGDDIVIIEINARWTGGLFPATLLDRLGVGSEHSVAFIDMIGVAGLPDYLDFITANVDAQRLAENGFRMVPMGFSPFPQLIDERECLYVWQVVVGDYEAFKTAKNAALGALELPTADLISL